MGRPVLMVPIVAAAMPGRGVEWAIPVPNRWIRHRRRAQADLRNAVTNVSVVGQDMVRRVAVVSRKRTRRVAERAPDAPIPLGVDRALNRANI